MSPNPAAITAAPFTSPDVWSEALRQEPDVAPNRHGAIGIEDDESASDRFGDHSDTPGGVSDALEKPTTFDKSLCVSEQPECLCALHRPAVNLLREALEKARETRGNIRIGSWQKRISAA